MDGQEHEPQTAAREDLFSGEWRASETADQLIKEFIALHRQIEAEYGPDQAELPLEEWAISRTLMARVSQLSLEERRYFFRTIWPARSSDS